MIKASLQVKDGKIYADCIAEASDHFTMIIDAKTFKIIECSRKEDTYTAHTVWKIEQEFRKNGIIPDSITAVWM